MCGTLRSNRLGAAKFQPLSNTQPFTQPQPGVSNFVSKGNVVSINKNYLYIMGKLAFLVAFLN